MEGIVKEINCFALSTDDKGLSIKYVTPKKMEVSSTDVDEMHVFLVVSLLVPQMKNTRYTITGQLTHCSQHQIIPRNRYILILHNLTLLKMLKVAVCNLYIDKSLMLFKGRLSFNNT